MDAHDDREWLEADGLGGFASGTASGIRTRRYHALLLAATTPPTGRMVLVNGFDAWVTTPAGRYAISSQRYSPNVVYPDGAARILSFSHEPWPRWEFLLEDGTRIQQEIVAFHERPLVAVSWKLLRGHVGTRLEVRPFLSGRDYHSLHHENDVARIASSAESAGAIVWHPYDGVPSVISASNGRYDDHPDWYRHFLYSAEEARGLDSGEDLFSPGVLTWTLAAGAAHWVVGTGEVPAPSRLASEVHALREMERARRAAFSTSLDRAAAAFIVRRRSGRTIIAGYPWFTDWGRDTFIALPGLCLETGRLDDARDILLAWASSVSEGMLPNRFPDSGEAPEFNAVDASLWFVIAVHAFDDAMSRAGAQVTPTTRAALDDAVLAIVRGYAAGTRHGIHSTPDGLLAAGQPGVQLTWMDARVDGREVTPRIGKPVEVQALWINALEIAGRVDSELLALANTARASFIARFWNDARACLYDVVDVDHVAGVCDGSIRPNQLLAVGGLPFPLVSGGRARQILDTVERELLVGPGIRTLSPSEPGYVGTYGGGVRERDGAYHQGTAWPWLLHAYADACARVRPHDQACADIDRVLGVLGAHLNEAGLGHVSEVLSGDAPHAPGGCPFQAWSLGALLRVHALRAHLRAPVEAEVR